MNQPVPNEGLSAYFDEELSASDRDEMARHLSESPEARRELAEIRRLSEELRHLPAESAPNDLLAAVQNHLDAEQPAEPAPMPAAKKPAGFFSTTTSVAFRLLTVAALLVVLVLKISSVWNHSQTADSQPTLAAKSRSSIDLPRTDEPASFPVLKQESQKTRKRRVNLGSEGKLLAENRRAVAKKQAPAPLKPAPLPADPQVGQLLELAQHQGDRVVIVEVTVVDVRKTLGQLQVLFARHAVPPGNFQLTAPRSPALSEGTVLAKDGSRYGLYVQSTSEQMSSTLAMLRRENAISRLEAKTTLAMNEIPVLTPGGGTRSSLRFGTPKESRQTLAQSVQNYQFQQRGPTLLGDAAEKAPPKAPAEEAKSLGKPQADRSTAGQPSAASLNLSKLQSPPARDQAQDKQAGAKSFQWMVQTPAEDWMAKPSSKSNSPATAKPKRNAPAPKRTENAPAPKRTENAPAPKNAKPEAGQKQDVAPVRLMFVFREQSQSPKP